MSSTELLEPGTHLVSPRGGYTHHGIYVGNGNVVQYGGLRRGLRRGPVEEVSLEQFANGHQLLMLCARPVLFDADNVVRRARSRLGEDRYHFLTNNCEHFCEWCLRAQHRSYQVESLQSSPNRTLRILCVILRKVCTQPVYPSDVEVAL